MLDFKVSSLQKFECLKNNSELSIQPIGQTASRQENDRVILSKLCV